MNITHYDTLSELVRVYFTPNHFGFDDWTVIKASLLEESSTLLVSLANPLQNEFRQVAVIGVTKQEHQAFKASYRTHYLSQLPHRFGFFLPGKRTGDVEYESFELFYRYWVEANGKNIVPFNIPLLVDFPSDLEYAEAKSDESIAVNYQRLLIIMAQPRKRQIKTIFIQNVQESDFDDIKETLITKVTEAAQELL